jgi:predicted amidohydrolase YtcJ
MQCADVLLVHGNIHTVDENLPHAAALALRGHRILAVGEDAAIRDQHLCPGVTTVVDLEGHTVLPGLIDAHAHLHNLGLFLRRLNLLGTRSFEEVVQRTREKVSRTPAGEWIHGRGWDQNDWAATEFPDRAALDALSSEHPILLGRVDGHAVLANHIALRAAGIDATTPNPSGGEIIRDSSGRATGVLIDNATALVESAVPKPSQQEKRDSIRLAVDHCLALGLTGVHDAGIDYDDWDVYRQMVDDGELGLRVYAMLGDDEWAVDDWFRREPELARGDRFTLRTMKVYMDGALGSRGAALLESYSDRKEHRGLLVTSEENVEAITRRAVEGGFQMAVHAIGDRGNRIALDVYQRALEDAPPGDYRLRVEHVQILSPDDQDRFASLGVIPSMQPTHCTSDMPWVPDRLGAERSRGGYVWRSLLRSGVKHLALGSDFPVESANPFLGIYAAVTRQRLDGTPEDGWNPQEALTRQEALGGFTLDAAYAAFQEADLGSLTAGKFADFIVLDRDPLAVPAAEIPATVVLETWVGGERAFQRP